MSEKTGSLAGLRVLDFSQVLSGPFCTQILADLGAEVIKVESPEGDVARAMPPHFVGGDSVYYLSINRNKRSIGINLKSPEGLAVARRLVLASDVVIENFRPGVMEKLGLSPVALRQEKPALIWCSVSGFGQNGPYRDKQAYDLIVQALSGGMSLTGMPDGPSVRAGIPVADLSAGLYAAIGILAALNRVRTTGRGELIDVSMMDCQAAMLCYQAAYHLHSGQVPGRQGRGHDSIASYQTFVAGDGIEIVVAAMTERMWQRLCEALGRNDLIQDARFTDAAKRRDNRDTLMPILNAAFASNPAHHWVETLEAAGVPVGTVNTMDRVVADPQIQARGMITTLRNEDGHEVRVMGDPLFMAETRRSSHSYPPKPNQDGAAILSEILGMSRDDVARLEQAGAIARPAKAGSARAGASGHETGESRTPSE